jgi:hypothetical protein
MRKSTKLPMLGKKFGLWEVLAETTNRTPEGSVLWLCRYACGVEREINGVSLRRGVSQSCGCVHKTKEAKARARAVFTTHGATGSPTHKTWLAMRRRCLDPNYKDYPHYGGRAITVCDRWGVFENFLADMGPRPKGLTLERLDTDGPYSKGNCIWASHKQQMNNTRHNHFITCAGMTMTVTQWAEYRGIPRARLSARLTVLGWPIWKALGYKEEC